MKIWLINHYAVPPQYYPLARPALFAKNLIKMGHDVTIIAASTVHNSDLNLITDNSSVKREIVDGVPYLYVRCSGYRGNGVKRAFNILEFAAKLPGICGKLERPDAIVATSFDPISCFQAIKYAKKHGIKAVAEIADLWPETLVAYTSLTAKNPIVRALRRIEREIYTTADAIVFTIGGGYDYIKDQGWESIVPKEKVFHINNGIDLEEFDLNRDSFLTDDPDLNDPDLFKVIYTGAIRHVNNVSGILDVAKKISSPAIKFLIWGDGDELTKLKQRVADEGISNVVFKGKVAKKYIPAIVSRADLNYAHNSPSPLFRYGISFNKIFDYLAAGKPVLCDFRASYNPVVTANAGAAVESAEPSDIARAIEGFAAMEREKYAAYCENARRAAEEYDFKELSKKLLEAISYSPERQD